MAWETGETSATAAEAEAEAAKVAAGEGERKIMLLSKGRQGYCVSEAAARVSPFLTGLIGDGDLIPLENVSDLALKTVVKYCNNHAAAHASAAASSSSSVNPVAAVVEVDDEDRELVGDLGTDDLHDVLIAAHFFGLEGLVEAVCERVATMIKERTTPRQIREAFNITDDLTAAEKAQNRRQYAWAFYDGDM